MCSASVASSASGPRWRGVSLGEEPQISARTNPRYRKSQLAIKHCYRTAEQSLDAWVFWVHASNTARLEQSFREIADRVKVRGRKDPQADVFKLVHDWLRDAKNGRWLLVLDNTDDAAVLSPTDGGSGLRQHLSRYLPSSRHGAVLVTSRTKRDNTRQSLPRCPYRPSGPRSAAFSLIILIYTRCIKS
jgi:hypothetical protein